MAEIKHSSEVESTPKTESSAPAEQKVSSEVKDANQSELKPQKKEETEQKEEVTEKKTDTPSSSEPLEKKETVTEVPVQEPAKEEEKKERPPENVPLQTEGNGGKLTKEETDALKDKIRADMAQMKESPSGYKDFENGVRDVPTDQPAKLSSKNFDKLYEQRGYSPEEIKEYKESFKGFPEQDKSLNNAPRHPEKTDADTVTARHITKDEPVNVYSNEKGASGRYSTHDELSTPSEVQNKLATPDYNTGEYKNESTLKTNLDDGRQNTVIEGTVAPQKADGKVFTEDRPGGGKQILTDGGYEGGGIEAGKTTRLESSPRNEITSVKGIDNEKPLGRAAENTEASKELRPLNEKERNDIQNDLGWTEKQLNKCSIGDDGVIRYKTDREDMEGKTGENGVPYERKTVNIHGREVEGVFPKFDSKFDAQLPEDLEKASNAKQFSECNKQLKSAIESDDALKSKFTSEQLADINDGFTPEGYVWHHNEEPGKMQLVRIEDHDRTQGGAAHTGGKALWGGSYGNKETASLPDETDNTNNDRSIKNGS